MGPRITLDIDLAKVHTVTDPNGVVMTHRHIEDGAQQHVYVVTPMRMVNRDGEEAWVDRVDVLIMPPGHTAWVRPVA